MASLHVSISAEPIAYIGNLAITNSMFTSVLVSLFVIIIAVIANSKITYTRRPKGLQNFIEFVIEALYKLTSEIIPDKKVRNFVFPLTTSFFFFILFNNWAGLLPGVGTINVEEPAHVTEMSMGAQVYAADSVVAEAESSESGHALVPLLRAGTADLNTTIALALVSMGAVQVLGFKSLGASYLKKFFNFKSPIFTFVGILELVSEIAKIISFAFRLFGNIFAGEVLLVVIAFLLPIAMPIPFIGLEIFVGLIQALVFTMLSIVFMSMATHAHDDH